MWINVASIMKQTNALERTAPPDEVRLDQPENEYGLKVAVLYQDAPTCKWAMQIRDQMARLAGSGVVRSNSWEIGSMNDPDVLMEAILKTMVADVILVSIYDAKEVPVDFNVWVDAWLPRRCQPMGALIALISVLGQPDDQTNITRNYLRAVARKGHLDFLLRERRVPAASRGFFYMEKAREWSDPMTSVIQAALTDEHKNLTPMQLNDL